MRGSSKPCPGCGQVKLGRPAKEVCPDCSYLLARAGELEDILSEKVADKIVVAFGRESHWNKCIYTHSGVGRGLLAIFHRLAMAGSHPSATYGDAKFELLGSIDSGGRYYAAMPAPLAEAIRDLRVAVQEALEQEYVAGKADGHNLLMRLASGEISTGAFDAKVNEG
ncbi:hypothetical protein LCGC14_2930600 [marine sediment metagenome]|uniref:Uncharacterized protein n=1 Tax=marine sediment metagenome TaxID=412755 RepID=A0A0F8Y7Y1_9ZZZZ